MHPILLPLALQSLDLHPLTWAGLVATLIQR